MGPPHPRDRRTRQPRAGCPGCHAGNIAACHEASRARWTCFTRASHPPLPAIANWILMSSSSSAAGGMWSATAIPGRKSALFASTASRNFPSRTKPSRAPQDFDARSFMEQAIRGQPQVQARLRFNAEAARIARTNRTFWDSFEEQADGSVVVTISAPDLNWAASTILAYGPVVEVLTRPNCASS